MKILVFSEAVSFAHIGRPLNLARWAQENGHETHFAASEKGLSVSQASKFGLKTHPIYTIDEKLFYGRVNQCKFFYTCNELKKYIEEEKSIILKIDPDLIISDFRLTTAISAELTGKPLLNLSNAYWSPNFPCNFPPPEHGVFNIFSQKFTNYIFNFIRPYIFKTFGKELNQVREFYGLRRKKDFRELYTDGTYTAYLDIPKFIKIENLPNNHFYLGPIIWEPETDTLKEKLNSKNYIYISMGSTGNEALIPSIIKIILKSKFNIILSGINNFEKENLIKEIPELKNRSIIEPTIQAKKILPNCILTICHGGSGTVYQSISSGVPVVCFPKNPDQWLVANAVNLKNIGRCLSKKNATNANIEETIDECITNELIKQSSMHLKNEIHQYDTKSNWLNFLKNFEFEHGSKKLIS